MTDDRKIRGFDPSVIRGACEFCGNFYPMHFLDEMPDIKSKFYDGNAVYCGHCQAAGEFDRK